MVVLIFMLSKIWQIFFENLATMSEIYTRKTQNSKNIC
jgi:hypothetical protein